MFLFVEFPIIVVVLFLMWDSNTLCIGCLATMVILPAANMDEHQERSQEFVFWGYKSFLGEYKTVE